MHIAFAEQPQDEPSAQSACSEIRVALIHLVDAERAQALALQLFARGGEVVAVENRYLELQDRTTNLRDLLWRIHSSKVGADPAVADCLGQGYGALTKAEEAGTEVERVLLKARGYPFATSSVRQAAPPDRSQMLFAS